MRSWSNILLLLLIGIGVHCHDPLAIGQDFQDPTSVKSTTEDVLNQRAFRHLRKSDEWKFPEFDQQPSYGSSRDGNGGSQSGSEGNGTVNDKAKSESNQMNRDEPSSSGSSSSMSSGSNSGSSNSGSSALGSVAEGFGSAVGVIFHLLAYVVIAIICALILFVIAKAIMNGTENLDSDSTINETIDETEETDVAPGILPADDYLQRARQLAGQGNYADAVAQLLLGTMSFIERREFIRYRRGLTIRDYLRAVRNRPQFDGLRQIVQVYEPIGFGRRQATREHYEQALGGYESGFQTTTAPLET